MSDDRLFGFMVGVVATLIVGLWVILRGMPRETCECKCPQCGKPRN